MPYRGLTRGPGAFVLGVSSGTSSMVKNITTGKKLIQYLIYSNKTVTSDFQGAQWLSGRVLDMRPKGSGFEPHRRHCVVVLEQDTFILA